MSSTPKKPAGPGRRSRRHGRVLEPRRTVEPSGYRAYIQSEAWQETRRKLLTSGRKRECYCCGKKDGPKDVHHRTYDNLGNERLRDLVFLCRNCHDYVHEVHRREPSLNLWDTTRAVRRERHPMHDSKQRIARIAAREAKRRGRLMAARTGCAPCKTERKARERLASPLFPVEFACPHPGSGPVPGLPLLYAGDRHCPECSMLVSAEIVVQEPGTIGYRCDRGHVWLAAKPAANPAA